jgi:hypothetical protein
MKNGEINKALFANEVRRAYKGQWNRMPDGQDEFVDWARIFSTFKPRSSSGTAENLAPQEIVKNIANNPLLRGGAGLAFGDVTGALGALVGPRAAQKLLRSKAFREFMLKQPQTRKLTPESKKILGRRTARGLGGYGTTTD